MTSKTRTDPAAAVTSEQPAEEAPVVITMTLQEFCERRSAVDRRVELLGGFFAVETAARRVEGTEKEFSDRLDAFINQPV